MASQRLSNFELCRLVSILCVTVVHTTFQPLGFDVPFGVLLTAGFSIIGVDVFVMLAGYFTATPKKISIVNLAFVCFFWMVISVAFHYVFENRISYSYLFFITSSNWFIPSYIGLLFMAPILNLFCQEVSEKALKTTVIALLFIEIWFDWLPPHPVISLGTHNGHSVLSFIILYLLARTIRLYGLPKWFKKSSLFVYIGCSLLLAVMAQYVLEIGHEEKVRWCFADNNPIVIVSSVAFLMMFEQIRMKQSNLINHLAKSTLAVLLGHCAIFFLYKKQFKFLYDHFSGIQVVLYWALAVIIVFCASIMLDQLRLLLYKPIEKFMKARIKNNVFVDISDVKK